MTMKQYDSQVKRCRNCEYFVRLNLLNRSAKGKCSACPEGTELIGPGTMGCGRFYPNQETRNRIACGVAAQEADCSSCAHSRKEPECGCRICDPKSMSNYEEGEGC